MTIDAIAGKRLLGGVMSFLCCRQHIHNIQKRFRRRVRIEVTSEGVYAVDELTGLDDERD
jgi:hypothetical protein